MKKDELEQAVLELWVTSRIPLTLANLQYHTGVSRRKLQKQLDQLLGDGTLEIDSDDAGEIVFLVQGAKRPADGPRDFAERDRLAALRSSVASELAHKKAIQRRMAAEARARRERERAEDNSLEDLGPSDEKSRPRSSAIDRLRSKYGAGTALSIAGSARKELDRGPGEGRKSLLASGALSTFLGPLGWLYAGSFREAIPAGAAFVLLWYLLPFFLFWPILPLSGIAGLIYAWQYNQTGRRAPLFLGDGEERK